MVYEWTAPREKDLHRATETKRQQQKERPTTSAAPHHIINTILSMTYAPIVIKSADQGLASIVTSGPTDDQTHRQEDNPTQRE